MCTLPRAPFDHLFPVAPAHFFRRPDQQEISLALTFILIRLLIGPLPQLLISLQAGSDSSNDEAELAPFRLENIKDRPPIFDAEALHDALEEFGWSQPADFAQTQVVTLASTAQESVPDIHDDMARELAFYNGAKDAAEQAIAKLDQAGIQWHRPPDYYAESVKSDAHMAKVKQQLMFEQQAIEEAEQRWAVQHCHACRM